VNTGASVKREALLADAQGRQGLFGERPAWASGTCCAGKLQGGLIVDHITIEAAVPTENSDDAGDDAVEQVRELLVGRWAAPADADGLDVA
jgi:hypothetical protein